jgi:hypothetical protein
LGPLEKKFHQYLGSQSTPACAINSNEQMKLNIVTTTNFTAVIITTNTWKNLIVATMINKIQEKLNGKNNHCD